MIFTKIKSLLSQPYPYYIPFSRSFKLLIILSAIIPLFLIIFRPFNLNLWDCEHKLWMILGLFVPIYMVLAFNFYFVARHLPSYFNEDKWTIGKELLWSVWIFTSIVVATSIYWLFVPYCQMSSIHWGSQFLTAFLIGIIPGAYCIYFNYSQVLKRKLNKISEINNVLASKVAYYEEDFQVFSDENEREKIKISTKNLILVQSQDNYSRIVWTDKDKISFKLIRSSLKNVEKQIKFPFIVRCHRSYIVNLSRVVKVTGNAREYKLQLEGHPMEIPISRELYKAVFRVFDDFSSLPASSDGISYKV